MEGENCERGTISRITQAYLFIHSFILHQLANPVDYLGGFIDDNPLSWIIRVLFVAVDRQAHRINSKTLLFCYSHQIPVHLLFPL